MSQRRNRRTLALGGGLTVVTLAFIVLPVNAAAKKPTGGFVYVMTNDPAGNAVIQYKRETDGSLSEVSRELTGGLGGGTGVDPLASQGSLVLSGDGSRLLAVNAGSNELSVLGAGSNGLTLLGKISSGGVFPNSVALSGDLAYVLNAQGTPNINGFRLHPDGTIESLAESIPVPGGVSSAPHQIGFSPDGTRLLVTEGGTNHIDMFEIGDTGLVTGSTVEPSAGAGPFGFRFSRGILVNTEAASNTVSSYSLTTTNTLALISASVPDGQMATCWLSTTRNGHTFVSNTSSGTLSSYRVSADGSITLSSAVAASIAPGAPIDSSLSSDGSFLYVVDSAGGRIVSFVVHGNNLLPLGSIGGLPVTTQGIAAQ